MTDCYFYLRRSLLSIFLIVCCFVANAQLQANFTVDKIGGCSPLTVSFTNTSTGTTPNTIYQWNFGNGHTSSLVNAGATYVLEQAYTVTLTATDGNKSSVQTKQVTVYKRPAVNFSFDVTQACLPVPVNYIATATAGDGTVANYFWDFGDGSTQQIATPQIQHTYNFAGDMSVGLTVSNSYGCYSSVEKNSVKVLPALLANFRADNKVLCHISDPVKFTNNTTGPGTITYVWDFGDGTGSTLTSPSHVYNKKGTYSVVLTATSSYGCENTIIQANYLNVRDYVSDFDVPSLICSSSGATFTDKSVPVANSKIWQVDNIFQCYGCNTFNYVFADSLAHTVQLINTYGNCLDTATRQIVPKQSPDIKPFIINIPPTCGGPVTVAFKDTTAGAVKWLWDFDWTATQPVDGPSNPSYTFLREDYHTTKLTVTNAAGCTAFEIQSLVTGPPNVGIYLINTSYAAGCDSVPAQFAANTTDSIVSYLWHFGDGATSTMVQPQHTFTQEGDFNVTLTYVTKNGCTGTTDPSYMRIHVAKRHPFDFIASGTTICGNTPVTFTLNSGSDYNLWDFGDGYQSMSEWNTTVTHQYTRDSVYTVSVRYSNDFYGLCPDTIIKKDYIKVLAPFPKILSIQNTCDGLRNTVTFKDTSYKALLWDWNFGDGTSHVINNTSQTITHTYATTGAYKVVLTNTSGQCAVRDSSMAYVLLKQHPVLSAPVTTACSSALSTIFVTNMETNPAPYPILWYDNYYYLAALQYGDTTNYNYNGYPLPNDGWQNSINWTITGLDPTKSDLRIISNSAYFGCNDTTNFIPFKIKGPKAGFKIVDGSPCFAYPVIIKDTSIAGSSSAIKTWDWDFGDFTNASENKGGIEQHIYAAPGQYLVQLKVTDGEGCTDNTANYYTDYASHFVNPSGPKSAFTYSPADVTPNTSITFTNNTNVFNSNSTQYQWLFGDGTATTENSPVHSFSGTGTDTVKLISVNPATSCRDTAIQVINVKLINTQFSFTKFYVSTNTCPPVIVHFTNTSANALSVAWNFGDGSIADNQNNPSHTYYKPGIYKITMYGYGYNGTTDTTVDSITVRAPNAKLTANKLSGCQSQNVTLSAAQVTNASYIIWDFADGGIQQSADTFAVHQYTKPGLYNPSLILTDSGGCSITANLADTIVIDALSVSFSKNSAHYCDSANVVFNPDIASVAVDSFHRVLVYHWNFGTGNAADTSNIRNPSFSYFNPGKYIVQLQVQSPYGCIKQTADTIVVVKKAIASITGPAFICQGLTAQFSGQATPVSGNLLWNWSFGNGNTSALQNPAPVIFADSGIFQILLTVTNDGCPDTVLQQLMVHALPVVNATPADAVVCLGKSVQLNAGGGNAYIWVPATGLNNNAIATPVASPVVSTKYIVAVTTIFGCKNTDTINITVAMPFTMKVPGDISICTGSSVHLNVTGAGTYTWINVTAGLSNTQIADPVAVALSPIIYTVVGYDAYHCFSDTALVNIHVHALPTIIHEPAVETLTGTAVQLQASGSADITSWSWLPPDYLSCSNCAAPVSTPLTPITYLVTGSTNDGCTVTDTVSIKVTCSISHIFVPNIFSPNGDSKNDVFYIEGKGIKTIRSLRIFNRWGEIVFDKANISVGDRSAGWDGTIKGNPATPGAYVYLAELICNTGEVYPLKGTVILMR